MKKNKKHSLFFMGLVVLFLTSCQEQQPITISSLLEEMINRESLTRYPTPEYRCSQFSSYDRRSVTPDSISWYANKDNSNFLRIDSINGRREFVLFDAVGPGAIVRYWSTFCNERCGQGILRFYFDNDSLPTIEGVALNILSGGELVGTPLSASVPEEAPYLKRGHNLYLPLPYAKHCKITYEKDNVFSHDCDDPGTCEAIFYNINYRTYTKETQIITFSKEELTKANKILEKVQNILSSNIKNIRKKGDLITSIAGRLSPGNHAVRQIKGENAIRQIKLRIKADNLEQALRTTILEFIFDGHRTVWCPAGDFFGTGYQIRPSSTWYTHVDANGDMESYWVMPFKKECEVKIHNYGEQDVELLQADIVTSSYDWNKESMYFCSEFKQYSQLLTKIDSIPLAPPNAFDLNFVNLKGKGVFVGDVLTLFNTAYGWWGEGDEKIYVDGEDFPSHFGTGTEDYYGYAWSRWEKINNHPFLGQPDGSGNLWPGYVVNLRFRSMDAIPFKQSLKLDMEMWHWYRTIINYAPTCFWYIKPGDDINVKEDMENIKTQVALKREDLISPYPISGRIEGENLSLVSKSNGKIFYQVNEEYGWSNKTQLWWNSCKVGDILEMAFYSHESDEHDLEFMMTQAPDYGFLRIYLNGNYVLDFNGQHNQIQTKLIKANRMKLEKGRNILKLQIINKPNHGKYCNSGIDYINIIKSK